MLWRSSFVVGWGMSDYYQGRERVTALVRD